MLEFLFAVGLLLIVNGYYGLRTGKITVLKIWADYLAEDTKRDIRFFGLIEVVSGKTAKTHSMIQIIAGCFLVLMSLILFLVSYFT